MLIIIIRPSDVQ